MQYDVVIAGAGMWGCTLARRFAESGRKVLVLEKRSAVGGNCRCEIDPETGIEIHTYGSHIFHTSHQAVWEFVNRFTSFNGYRHCVLANCRGKIYHLPIGCTLLKEFFGRDIKPSELTAEERHAVFDAFVRGYTSKQWGVPPEKVDSAVIKRLKVRDNDSTRYFDDLYEGIPTDGYNKLFERLLNHPNIEVETEMTLQMVGTDLRAVRNPDSTQIPLEIDCGRPGRPPLPIYYSGPIDELFGYKFGALPWRSLRFETEKLPIADFQGNSVVNYPDVEVPYTRIHEFKHYHPEWGEKVEKVGVGGQRTIIMREFSKAWEQGDEPYYPIATPESAALLAKYQEEVEKLNHRSTTTTSNYNSLIVGGRLGSYKYYDMDKAIAAAMGEE